LGGDVGTRDIARGKHIATAIECGSVFINDSIRSDPRLPFGGSKESGYGREFRIKAQKNSSYQTIAVS